jgi:hypothetical protein
MSCGSKGGAMSACCPTGEIFQEELCGNLAPNQAGDVWGPPIHDYAQGTFVVFNADSTGNINVIIHTTGGDVPFLVPPSSSYSRSVVNPIALNIDTTGITATGSRYCATLYKRVFYRPYVT